MITEIDYSELQEISSSKEELLEKIGQGFGNFEHSLGIITVTNIPNYKDLRTKLLRLSHELATSTSKEDLKDLTIKNSNYQVGWSHGQERVEGEDKFDNAKGSYYANPLSDDVLTYILDRDFPEESGEKTVTNNFSGTKEEFIKLAQSNPAFFAKNVWPKTLPDLEINFKAMGILIHSIGKLIAKACDEYVWKKCPEYERNKIEATITTSMCCKGRLLHYFPNSNESSEIECMDKKEDVSFSGWCGWHNDHCLLTGLVPAMYIDSMGNEIECPDPSAGLYIKSRKGNVVHVKVPSDCLAFQIGETAQINTGGILQATPHAVRGCNQHDIKSRGVSREAFALFMEPEFHGDMNIPVGKTIEDAQGKESESHLPATVKTLRSRWKQGMNFGEFSNATFAAFY